MTPVPRSCQLWTHTLSTGESQLILETTSQWIEAPNWTPDGDSLVLNADGSLYRIPAVGGELEQIPTGQLADLNNDHVLSPDGATIYLSSNDGHLYSVAAAGGEPRRITNDRGPDFHHYLHGVSPDGGTLAYVGVQPYQGVPGMYRNVFTIPAAGGADIQLTDSPSAAAGPEFSVDGQWIWFNSEHGAQRPGHAQIFRMRTDGSELTQMTFDERVNWFPHVSPDGTRILYLSFPPGTEGHPSDRDVVLRTMTPDGQDITDVVALQGGQGTINVNSWAPDSDRFAYVSYPR
jgi:TolB protein